MNINAVLAAFAATFVMFVSTAAGALCVFFIKGSMSERIKSVLMGFASGVMCAASIWSLLIPSLNESRGLLPTLSGLFFGALFLMALDRIIRKKSFAQGGFSSLMTAVTLHNIPEGMAVGLAFALAGNSNTAGYAAAAALAFGMCVQNFPEGMAISLPMHASGKSKKASFIYGSLSGIVEPIAGVLAAIAAYYIKPLMPFFLSFAAGAMLLVTYSELIPESVGADSFWGSFSALLGFAIMMALDVALG